MCESLKKISLLTIFLSSFAAQAAPPNCGPELSFLVTQALGQVSHSQSSFVKLDAPLVPATARVAVLKKTLKDFSKNGSLDGAQFFSQFTIDEEGRLHTIVDPTVVKDAGDDIARQWEQDPKLRAEFAKIYRNTKNLADELTHSLPETPIELAEVVFTLQVNKVSENWHLDWYDQEYLIATQTFLAKKQSNGSLIDEDEAGTEYLLFGNLPEVRQAATEGMPKKIELVVHTDPPVGLVAKGFHYSTPTHALSMHSGNSRVHSLLGISKDGPGLTLVSPPHRGSYKPLAIRGSLAIRFKPATK